MVGGVLFNFHRAKILYFEGHVSQKGGWSSLEHKNEGWWKLERLLVLFSDAFLEYGELKI